MSADMDRTPAQMREDSIIWSRAEYPAVAVGRYRDAADQIERLMRQLAFERAGTESLQRQVQRRGEELDRLREALRDFLDTSDACLMASHDSERWGAAHKLREEARARARQLLAAYEPLRGFDEAQSTGELEELRAVALAAQALVRSASGGSIALETELVSEPALTALETALAAAGYDMTDEELEERLREGNGG